MNRAGPALRLINGDLDQRFHLNGVTIRLTPLERRLPEVQAVVVEQDTGLLLDEAVELNPALDDGTTPSEILLEEEYYYPLGTVLLKRGKPVRLQMVIHDLERKPNWSEEGVARALHALFSMLPRLGIDSLAMPAPAHHHGGLAMTPALTLLCTYLIRHPLTWQGELWLLLPRQEVQSALAVLHTLCDTPTPE